MLERLGNQTRPVIGCFPLYPPVELINAMGATPVLLWGLGPLFHRTPQSDRRLQDFTCSVARRLTEFILSDQGNVLDGLVMYNACDTLRNLPEILAHGLEEAGRSLPIVRLHVPMTPRKQTTGDEYLKTGIDRLIDDLSRVFGLEYSDEAFKLSVVHYHIARSWARSLETKVALGELSFTRFAELISENHFRPIRDQIDLLMGALKQWCHAPGLEEPRGRVVISGILPPPPPISEAIEAAGLRVVGNDVASLSRSYEYTPETGPPREYFTDFYSRRKPCSTLLYTADDRFESLLDLAQKQKADGVIFVGEKYCEYEYLEFPVLEKRLQEHGFKTLTLEISLDDVHNVDAYKTRIETFTALME